VTRAVALRLRDGGVACERCLIADRPLARMRGLLGRPGLESGEGLLLRPAASIHTFFMRFPIDVVFLDRKGTVLKVRRHVRPWRLAGCWGAHATLELPAGEAQRRALHAGVRVAPIGGEVAGNE
jgi:uncharacterized membrane protein (UPF0127 family)